MTKNNYWLTITNEANWEIIKKNELYAFNKSHKNFLDEIKIGDYIVMYVIRRKKRKNTISFKRRC